MSQFIYAYALHTAMHYNQVVTGTAKLTSQPTARSCHHDSRAIVHLFWKFHENS